MPSLKELRRQIFEEKKPLFSVEADCAGDRRKFEQEFVLPLRRLRAAGVIETDEVSFHTDGESYVAVVDIVSADQSKA
jgi:hypothetical protein